MKEAIRPPNHRVRFTEIADPRRSTVVVVPAASSATALAVAAGDLRYYFGRDETEFCRPIWEGFQ
jgi:hypothetical protein